MLVPVWGSHRAVAGTGGATCGLSCGRPQPWGDRGPPSPWGGRTQTQEGSPYSVQSPKPTFAPHPTRRLVAPAPARAKGRRDPVPGRGKLGFLPVMGISQGDGCSLRRANGSRQEKPPLGSSCVPSDAVGSRPPNSRTPPQNPYASVTGGVSRSPNWGRNCRGVRKNVPEIPFGGVSQRL